MTFGASIFLIALGAILTWGVEASDTSGFNLDNIGMILMAVGALGFILSFIFMGGFGYDGIRGRRTYVRDDVIDVTDVEEPPVLVRRGRRVI